MTRRHSHENRYLFVPGDRKTIYFKDGARKR